MILRKIEEYNVSKCLCSFKKPYQSLKLQSLSIKFSVLSSS